MNTITMPITQVRVNLGAVVEKVRTKVTHITLEKGGIPVATLVNNEYLEDLHDTIALMQARENARNEPRISWKEARVQYV